VHSHWQRLRTSGERSEKKLPTDVAATRRDKAALAVQQHGSANTKLAVEKRPAGDIGYCHGARARIGPRGGGRRAVLSSDAVTATSIVCPAKLLNRHRAARGASRRRASWMNSGACIDAADVLARAGSPTRLNRAMPSARQVAEPLAQAHDLGPARQIDAIGAPFDALGAAGRRDRRVAQGATE